MLVAAALAASASAISRPQVFSLLAISAQNPQPINGFTFQRDPQGGDAVQIQDSLYRWAGAKKGARAGRDHGLATFLTNDGNAGASILVTVQFYLQQGTILVDGIVRLPGNGPATFTLPIVGGTGDYDGARGYLSVRDLGNGNQNKSNMEFHLLR